MYPFKLIPAVKNYIWGGNRLSREYGLPQTGDVQAEGWMLSCHKDGENTVANGAFAGKTLTDVLAENPSFTGTNAAGKDFPILIKLIDAKDRLSVQVHPDDEYAMRVEGEYGKTEAWYIIDCDEGAELIYGFKDKITSQQFREAIENNTLLDCVNRVKVKKGDLFFITAGTLHAIGKGILLAEIQQNSNTTYRVYDYGRLQNGKPRELHVDKAVDVTVCEPPKGDGKPCGEKAVCGNNALTCLVDCELFKTELLEIDGEIGHTADKTSFVSLLAIDGEGNVVSGNGNNVSIKKGESIFLPAGSGDYCINGKLTVIRTTV